MDRVVGLLITLLLFWGLEYIARSEPDRPIFLLFVGGMSSPGGTVDAVERSERDEFERGVVIASWNGLKISDGASCLVAISLLKSWFRCLCRLSYKNKRIK